MLIYYLEVITGGELPKESYVLQADEMECNSHGFYYFFNRIQDIMGRYTIKPVAYFPINKTIITKIEKPKL